MKNNMKISKPIMITAGALILLGVITASAIDNQISACVANDSGKIRIINFLPNMTKQCAPTETLLIWNKEGIQGPKGDTGEKGEPGLPAQHGAGNIAFVYSDGSGALLLKTDGTAWWERSENSAFRRVEGNIGQVPIPVNQIIDWNLHNFLDENGNFWRFSGPDGNWVILGPLP